MDFSNDYITMCDKATEVQNYLTNRYFLANFWYDRKKKEFGNDKIGEKSKFEGNGVNLVWLPSIDQIQKMYLKDKEIKACNLIQLIHRKLETSECYFLKFNTLEQLFLSIFMLDKHSKKWDFDLKEWSIKQSTIKC